MPQMIDINPNTLPQYGQRRSSLSMALFIASVAHAMVGLGISFKSDSSQPTMSTPHLEIILTQQTSQSKPDEAKYLANNTQDGGGDTDDYNRPSAPFSSESPTPSDGIAPVDMQSGQTQPTPKHQTLVMTRVHSNYSIPDPVEQVQPKPKEPVVENPSDIDLRIAQMTAELNRKKEEKAKRPRKRQLTASTMAHFAASYMKHWVERIERIGNNNLPPEARNLSGNLMMKVELKHDGTLVEAKILRSSGSSVLDATAKRIVFLATPYDKFPPKLRAEADHVEIVRTWEFNAAGLTTHFSDSNTGRP